MVVTLPADHIIGDHSKFEQIISSGYSKAKDCNFIIYGIEPTHVSTSFGYIKHTDNKFEGFVEKPNIDEARKYFNSDNYFWNSGMISAEVQTFKNGLSKHIPDIYSKTNKAISNCVKIMDENTKSLYVDEQDYKDIQEISIDHSLLEKIDNIEVIKFDTSWLDVGTWDQYATMFECDKNQNYINGETMMIDTNSCIISSDDKIIATLGIDNLIISDTKDALLVASKDRAQEVKDLYSKLKQIKHNSIESPSEVIRPWGKYEILKKGNNFKIKLITLNEKSSISLQHHNHRQEHWTVLSGKAEVIKNNEVSELKPSESITIPKGIKHRLINKQDFPLRICEIQQGDYLEEDDIIRHDDVYNRT